MGEAVDKYMRIGAQRILWTVYVWLKVEQLLVTANILEMMYFMVVFYFGLLTTIVIPDHNNVSVQWVIQSL